MADTPLKNLVAFALEKLRTESLDRRARLYRDIAIVCGNEAAAQSLNDLAHQLDEIERKHKQLGLDFGDAGLS